MRIESSGASQRAPGSPMRLGSQGGGTSRTVTAQRRQQALRNCLDTCESLGFSVKDPDAGHSTTARKVCQLVDAADNLSSLQLEANAKENADLYGKLLEPKELQSMDCLVGFLQQPLPALTIESGRQAALQSLLQHASQDGPMLSKGIEDVNWVLDFKEPVSTWPKLLNPSPTAAIAAVHCHEGLAAVLEALTGVAGSGVHSSEDLSLAVEAK